MVSGVAVVAEDDDVFGLLEAFSPVAAMVDLKAIGSRAEGAGEAGPLERQFADALPVGRSEVLAVRQPSEKTDS
jgi:hypothetical protein